MLVFLTSCNPSSSGSFTIPLYLLWGNSPKAVSIDVEDIDVEIGSESYDFSAFPLTVHYDDGASEVVVFDITNQVQDFLDGGVAHVEVTHDGATASFEIYFYDMKIDDLINGIAGLMQAQYMDPSAFEEFCSNKHILITNYTANEALAIDRFDSMTGSFNVFGNTYFRGAAEGADVTLTAHTNAFPMEISAIGIDVENADFTAADSSGTGRIGACAIYGSDIRISNVTLVNKLTKVDGNAQNAERTGITIQKGKVSDLSCGTDPQYPESVLIEDTAIEDFDVSVNISGFATLRNVAFDSPIVIAIADKTRLDDIVIEDPVSLVEEGKADVVIIAGSEEEALDPAVASFVNRLEGEGLTVEVKAEAVEIGDITIAPWEPGGSMDVSVTMD